MKCSVCGLENQEDVLFCAQCGKALKEEPITLDLEQIKVPAAFRKTHIIKVSAKTKDEVLESAPEAQPEAAEENTSDEKSESEYIDLAAPTDSTEPTAPPVADTASQPMRKRDWLPVFLLSAIPVVNIIMLLIWAFSSGTNKSKKSFAQMALIFALIGIVIAVAAVVLYAALFQVNLSNFTSFLPK